MLPNRLARFAFHYSFSMLLFISTLMSGCTFTLSLDDTKTYPALKSTDAPGIPSGSSTHLAVAGTLVINDSVAKQAEDPEQLQKRNKLLLDSLKSSLLSEASFLSVTVHNASPINLVCRLQKKTPVQTGDNLECELPDHWSNPSFDAPLRKAGVTHLLLVLVKLERSKGEREIMAGIAAGYGGAAPVVTTETETTHHFDVHTRLYDLETGRMVSEVLISDEETGSYGVMGLIMPYKVRVDDNAYLQLMARRTGEELGRRFVRGQQPR